VAFEQHTLNNGLEIVAECRDDAHSLGVGFFVRTGSRDETEAVAGVSHFLEHMVFKGTPTRSATDVNREFDEMGAHYNAFTSEENTVFYASVLPDCQTRCVALLADILRPSLREEDFRTEKQVIVEEIRMYDDQPPFGADDRCKAIHFGSHPLGHSVLGTVDSITRLTAEQMRDYFEHRYSPQNIVLAAAGRVDFPRLVKDVASHCDRWSPIVTSRRVLPPESHEGFELLERASATQQYVLQMISGPGAEASDRFAAKLLATVVGDDSGSRFYWDLIDTGQAEHASLNHYEYQDTGVYMTYLCCDPERAAANLRQITDIYRQLEQDGVREEELRQAKTKVKSRIVLGSERPRNRLFSVGGNWVSRHEYRTVADDVASIDAVSVGTVRGLIERYPLTRSTSLAVGPLATWPTM